MVTPPYDRPMEIAFGVLVIAAALIHVPPVVGALGPERVTAMYGVRADSPELALLLRHRAILFGILAGLLIACAWITDLRPAALTAALVSDTTFLALAHPATALNDPVRRVVRADIVSIALLLAAVVVALFG